MKKRLVSLMLALGLLASPLPAVATPVLAAEESVQAGEVESATDELADLPDSDELFAQYVQRTLYGDSGVSTLGNFGETALEGMARTVYDHLKKQVAAVANGERASTEFTITWEELGVTKTSWTEEDLGVPVYDGGVNQDAIDAALEQMGYTEYLESVSLILDYLRVDCPYDLYWHDKTVGIRRTGKPAFGASSNGESWTLKLNTEASPGITMWFAVAADYAGADAYTVDTEKTGATQVAVQNAKQIVEQNAALTDYDKLVAYRDAICSLVDYNHEAADNDGTPYGDPWQMIYVFDGDPDTKVVCEGYSKAFQYLFDISSFQNDLRCYTVTGEMAGGTGAGGHMWNIVTMEDGNNYLVDITNSDAGTIGQDGGLFLAGTTGSVRLCVRAVLSC